MLLFATVGDNLIAPSFFFIATLHTKKLGKTLFFLPISCSTCFGFFLSSSLTTYLGEGFFPSVCLWTFFCREALRKCVSSVVTQETKEQKGEEEEEDEEEEEEDDMIEDETIERDIIYDVGVTNIQGVLEKKDILHSLYELKFDSFLCPHPWWSQDEEERGKLLSSSHSPTSSLFVYSEKDGAGGGLIKEEGRGRRRLSTYFLGKR